VPGRDQPGDDVADLRGGDLGLIVVGPRRTASSTAVHEVRPGSLRTVLAQGVPLVIPITGGQPCCAKRCESLGVARVI
jgi:hypothetical protein